jgi:hypothetical protein
MTAAPSIPERRIRARLRPIREMWDTEASWIRVEPGPTQARRWAAVAMYGALAICIASLLGWFGVLVRQTVRWENLRTRGVTASAYVMHTQTIDDGGVKYYVDASVEECGCMVTVRVNSAAYDSAAPILIRYDPRDHSNAVPVVNRPHSSLAIGLAAFVAVLAVLAVLAAWPLYTRRRCKAVVRKSGEPRPVMFLVWRRFLGNAHHFLVLYDTNASGRSEPLCCVPVPFMSLRRLRADDVLSLYGDGSRPAVLLRRARRIILPCGPAKPGRWEHELRTNERR